MRLIERFSGNSRGFVKSTLLSGLCLLGLTLCNVGCTNAVHDENLALHTQNRELQAQKNELQGRLAEAEARARMPGADAGQVAALQKEIADRDARISELQNSLTRSEPMPASGRVGPIDPTLAGIETTYDSKAGTLTVNLPGDVLFDSGKAVLKSSALSTLDKISSAIKRDYHGKRVSVNGFTDSDPITRSKEQWDDNWDLSYGRAKSVAQYLKKTGVDEHSVSIVANGANRPKATKPASRRVEIVVHTR